jgi:hypothetical protein
VAHGDRNNGDYDGGLDERFGNDIYRGNDAYVYIVSCASQNDVHATFCHAGKYAYAIYDVYCANHDDHHILFGNDREHGHGVCDVPGCRHEQKIHQRLQTTD